MEASYLVPSGFGEAELVEKRSRFISRLWPVASEEEALTRIRETRERYWDAAHNVYAYVLREGLIMRYSDDGEPQGTSGLPTLSVLRSAGVFDACCVTTRYFGGALLGTGGLVRAYSQAASLALKAAGASLVKLWERVLISVPYAAYERVRKELSQLGAVIESASYGAAVELEALVDKGGTERLNRRLRELSSGAVEALLIGEEFRAVKTP
jgi:uncharacterized YigZ family protein